MFLHFLRLLQSYLIKFNLFSLFCGIFLLWNFSLILLTILCWSFTVLGCPLLAAILFFYFWEGDEVFLSFFLFLKNLHKFLLLGSFFVHYTILFVLRNPKYFHVFMLRFSCYSDCHLVLPQPGTFWGNFCPFWNMFL